jgi:hypothetical protein
MGLIMLLKTWEGVVACGLPSGGALHRFGRNSFVFQCEKQFGRKRQIMRLPRPDDAAIASTGTPAQGGI